MKNRRLGRVCASCPTIIRDDNKTGRCKPCSDANRKLAPRRCQTCCTPLSRMSKRGHCAACYRARHEMPRNLAEANARHVAALRAYLEGIAA